jgi:murein L,D-transpeptidase YcbB/YkuD
MTANRSGNLVFKSEINYITLNPTWTVPPTIFKEDALPAIRRSLSYLSRNHIRVLDSKGKEISPTSVNWSHPGNIMLRQDAGSGNSLGQLVIHFPNSYSVYMHDTPHQAMFGANQRAFSSGCIRVERVQELAVLLLNDPEKWNRAALETELSTNKTHNVTLSKKVPVLLAYWTVDVGQDGHVSYKSDIYQQDADVIKALDNHQNLLK